NRKDLSARRALASSALRPLISSRSRSAVVLVIHLRHALRRLYQDQSVHPIGNVHTDRGGRAVIDVDTLVESLEAEHRFMSWRREARGRPTTRSGHPVEIDVVRHLRARMVAHGITLPDADEAARDGAAERPESVIDALGDRLLELAYFELDDHAGRIVAMNGWRNVRRTCENGLDRLTLGRAKIAMNTGWVGLTRQ